MTAESQVTSGGRWPKLTDEEYDRRWAERVKARCDVTAEGCWIWRGHTYPNGYGMTSHRGKNVIIHRKMYEVANGTKLDRWVYACHSCDIKRCCSPGHIWPGTPHENSLDSALKGRHQEGRKTECERGHPLSGDNVRIGKQKNGGPRRTCKTCERERMQSPQYKARALERQRLYRSNRSAA